MRRYSALLQLIIMVYFLFYLIQMLCTYKATVCLDYDWVTD